MSVWPIVQQQTAAIPQGRVYAEAIHLRPDTYLKVEDSATMVLKYKNGTNNFEGSWDLPRGFHHLDIFGSAAAPDGKLLK